MRALTVALAALLTLSCTTTVNVERIVPGSEVPPGIPYYLPAPFLKVTPAADGTVTVDIVYLPDPDRQYAVAARTVLAKYKLLVELDDYQLLKKVDLTGSSADVAEQVAKSAGETAKAAITAEQAERKAAKDKEEAVAKARKDAVDAARKAVEDAELALLKTPEGATPEERKKSGLDLLDEQATRDAAAAKLTALEASSSGVSSALADKSAAGTAGPLLFRIVDDGKTVSLIPAKFETAPSTLNRSLIPPNFPSSAPGSDAPAPLSLFPQGSTKLSLSAKGGRTFQVVSSAPISKAEPGLLLDDTTSQGALDASGKAIALGQGDIVLNSPTMLTVTLPKTALQRSYTVTLGITPAGQKASTPHGIRVEVVP